MVLMETRDKMDVKEKNDVGDSKASGSKRKDAHHSKI